MKLLRVENLDHLKTLSMHDEGRTNFYKDFRMYMNTYCYTAKDICYMPNEIT